LDSLRRRKRKKEGGEEEKKKRGKDKLQCVLSIGAIIEILPHSEKPLRKKEKGRGGRYAFSPCLVASDTYSALPITS